MNMPARYPRRIVCLTEETTETLYLLGEERRIVGISGYTVRPPQARREKPRVSAFLTAKTDKILQLTPDLVIGFSDLQADIARELAKAGLNVIALQPALGRRDSEHDSGLSSVVGASDKGLRLVKQLEAGVAQIRADGRNSRENPKSISGMGRADDQRHPLGERAHRHRRRRRRFFRAFAFPRRERSRDRGSRGSGGKTARGDPGLLVRQEVPPERVAAAAGLGRRARGARRELHEIKSAEILQPGPAALTDGVRRIHAILADWARRRSP